jgi:YkoY family integral membrane protein
VLELPSGTPRRGVSFRRPATLDQEPPPVHFEWSDLLTVLILIVLEGLLSGDNALVLAVLVLPLPEHQQRKALRYGIIGAFVLRIIATLLAVWLVRLKWVGLVGGLYLLYLPWKHFTARDDHGGAIDGSVKTFLGLSLFWTIVVKAEMTDLVFAVDSILAAVALVADPSKTWVIIAGGLLGLLMMRLLAAQVLDLVKAYPKLVDGAYIVIAWVGIKLLWHFFEKLHFPHGEPLTFGSFFHHLWLHMQGKGLDHHHGYALIPELPEWLGIGMVVVLFTGGFLYAKAHAARDAAGADLQPSAVDLTDGAGEEAREGAAP